MSTAALTYSQYFERVKYKSDLRPGPMLSAYLNEHGWFAYDNLPAHPGAPTPEPRIVPLHMVRSVEQLGTPARRQKFIDQYGMDAFIALPETL